ncbi:MAG: winged helix-turn-helix domain-containing protein, partial [Thermoplasmatales archaeon]|nr:winged helix-turn-helix domain-containing protein [Thermoplasmatales archaeon]
MLNPVELGIFKALDAEMYLGEIVERIKLAESTVSKYINLSIQKGNGLFEKRRDGKKVYVRRSNTAHANFLLSIINEYPRWEMEKLFSYAKIDVAASTQKAKTADEIAYITGFTRQHVNKCLKE